MCMHFKVLIFYLGKKKCKSWGFGRQNGDVEEIGENQAFTEIQVSGCEGTKHIIL